MVRRSGSPRPLQQSYKGLWNSRRTMHPAALRGITYSQRVDTEGTTDMVAGSQLSRET